MEADNRVLSHLHAMDTSQDGSNTRTERPGCPWIYRRDLSPFAVFRIRYLLVSGFSGIASGSIVDSRGGLVRN